MANNFTDEAGNQAGGTLIYNTTYQVAHAVHQPWLQWMQDIYIPEVTGTGCFTKHQFVRVLDTDETDGPVFAVQYYAASEAAFEQFMAVYQQGLAQQLQQKWGKGVFGFSSLMQVV